MGDQFEASDSVGANFTTTIIWRELNSVIIPEDLWPEQWNIGQNYYGKEKKWIPKITTIICRQAEK